jgi:hypothetical protein
MEFHSQSVPQSAEAVSRKVAPLLTTKSAEQVYAYVQVQHAELHQQHELAQNLAAVTRTSTFAALAACFVAGSLLTFSLWLLHRKSKAAAPL